MRNFMKPCIDCGELSRSTRCETHTQQHTQKQNAKRDSDPRRKEKKKQLYNWDYQQRRKQLLANATHCHICGKAFTPQDRIEADHLIPHDPYSPIAPAHRTCNQQRGAKPLEQTFE